MSGKLLTYKQTFDLVTWLQTNNEILVIQGNAVEISKRASADLGFTVSVWSIRKSMKELGLKTSRAAQKKVSLGDEFKFCLELSERVQRIEKFLAINFSNEWENIKL